ncbi:Pre-mRNA-splicing factor SLU7, partial [Intoshia linei]
MSQKHTLPVSKIIKLQDVDEDGDVTRMKSRSDYKKYQELDEARKDGAMAPLKDERGHDINPHIPRYMMDAPWYITTGAPTLSHQRHYEHVVTIDETDEIMKKRSRLKRPPSTHYRPGACENCGAMGHTKKECMEKPRKISAKFSNKNLCSDDGYIPTEVEKKIYDNLNFSAKRDRWKGYDPRMYNEVVEEFESIEETRKKLKEDKLNESVLKADEENEFNDKKSDEEVEETGDVPGQKFESKERITVRNLRIREDTAKYLYNLDLSSAFYDPKSRSMRDNPFVGTNKSDVNKNYFGDNFELASGDVQNMTQQQLFAWEAYERGTEVQLSADPTKLALLNKAYKQRVKHHKISLSKDIINKYGGEQYMKDHDKILDISQTDAYEEYDNTGKLIKSSNVTKILSIYPEDDYHGNHVTIWGSHYLNGEWGYKCCMSTIYDSYCTGEVGIEAKKESIKFQASSKVISFIVFSLDNTTDYNYDNVKKTNQTDSPKNMTIKVDNSTVKLNETHSSIDTVNSLVNGNITDSKIEPIPLSNATSTNSTDFGGKSLNLNDTKIINPVNKNETETTTVENLTLSNITSSTIKPISTPDSNLHESNSLNNLSTTVKQKIQDFPLYHINETDRFRNESTPYKPLTPLTERNQGKHVSDASNPAVLIVIMCIVISSVPVIAFIMYRYLNKKRNLAKNGYITLEDMGSVNAVNHFPEVSNFD